MNSILKNSIIVVLFLLFALLQNSFFVHLTITGTVVSLVFILFFAFVFFEKTNHYYQGLFITLLAGSVLDLCSSFYFGANIISLLLTYALVKTLRYFLTDSRKKFVLLYFLPIFAIGLLFYQALYCIFTNFPHVTFVVHVDIFVGLLYNTAITVIGFLIYYMLFDKKDRQLKLF